MKTNQVIIILIVIVGFLLIINKSNVQTQSVSIGCQANYNDCAAMASSCTGNCDSDNFFIYTKQASCASGTKATCLASGTDASCSNSGFALLKQCGNIPADSCTGPSSANFKSKQSVNFCQGGVCFTDTDSCNGNTVTDYYCNGLDEQSSAKQCSDYGSDWSCSDGACVQQTSCTDSDGGKTYNLKGTTIGSNGQFIDSCETVDSVKEYFCYTYGPLIGQADSVFQSCPNGCTNGACINTCTDSTWSPDYSARCVGERLTQTSNCGNTRTVNGAKTCPNGYTCLNGNCYTNQNTVNNWVSSPSECVTPKPSACADKRCVTNELDCSSVSCPGSCPSSGYTCGSGVCIGYTPNPNGTKAIGESCTYDTDCASHHCDTSHWYSLSKTCQATPWDELIRIAVAKDDIKTMTTSDKINIACVDSEHCKSITAGKVAKCEPINQLVSDETISSTEKTSFFNTALSRVQTGTIGGLIGGGTGGALCLGTSAAIGILFPPSVPVIIGAAPTICSFITIGGVAIGAAEGLKTPVDTGDKNVIVQKLKAKDGDSVGLCVLEDSASSSGSGFSGFLKGLAFIKITGDKTVDGLIVLMLLISVFGFLFKK